jgi:hypothetical protein
LYGAVGWLFGRYLLKVKLTTSEWLNSIGQQIVAAIADFIALLDDPAQPVQSKKRRGSEPIPISAAIGHFFRVRKAAASRDICF